MDEVFNQYDIMFNISSLPNSPVHDIHKQVVTEKSTSRFGNDSVKAKKHKPRTVQSSKISSPINENIPPYEDYSGVRRTLFFKNHNASQWLRKKNSEKDSKKK